MLGREVSVSTYNRKNPCSINLVFGNRDLELLSPIGRSYHSSVILSDGTILVMGGNTAGGTSNEIWKSINAGVTWTLATDQAWSQGKCGDTHRIPVHY